MSNEEITLTGHLSPSYRLEIDFVTQLKRILQKFQDKDLEITISVFHRQRSLAQNRWMWGVCIPTIIGWYKDTRGEKYSKEEIYALLQTKVLGQEIKMKEVDGEEVFVIDGKTMKTMTTKEFSEAVDTIADYYAEKGLIIPMPKSGTNNLLSDYLNSNE